MTSSKTDMSIVEGYLSGDRDSVTFIDESINATLANWRNRFGYQLDDIISDSRYKLYISLQRGDFAQKSTLRAYVSGIVRHTCIDYYRVQQRIEKIDIDECPLLDGNPSAEEGLERREAAFLNFRVLRHVPIECLKIWRLQLTEGLNCREIGERLGASEVNIRGKLMKCRQKAREIRKKLQKK